MPLSLPANLALRATEHVNVKAFGARGDGTTDDATAIQAAIDHAAATVNGASGAVVFFPTGTYLIGAQINLPNRVGLQGANGRGVVIKLHASFADSYMMVAENGTSSMFGSWVRDIYIDGRGKNLTALVWAKAWQETCGMERVLLHFDGTTANGLLLTDGYGGAAYLPLRDIEIFANSTNVNAAGIKVDTISLVGGFILSIDGITIAGDATNKLPIGIRMVNDSLVVKGCHGEYISDAMVAMDGAGSLSADTLTGSSADVVDMVVYGGSAAGRVNLRNMIPNGATGNIFKDNKTGRHIPVAVGMLAEFTYQPSAFLATLSADLENKTGNGTEYTVLFNNEVHDYLGEYNPATGQFTATRAGRYLFHVAVKLAVPAGGADTVIRLDTSNRSYEIFRGSVANVVSSATQFTATGAVVADMDAGDVAYVLVFVSGVGADTADVIGGTMGSSFGGQWLSR